MSRHLRMMSSAEFCDLIYADYKLGGRFSFFIGAGCSLSSGIPTAGMLVHDRWLPLIQRRYTKERGGRDVVAKEILSSYDPKAAALSYAAAIDCLFPHAAERQQEIEAICSNRFPGFGYACLAALMTLSGGKNSSPFVAGAFNVVATTNFDDLLADALYLFTNTRPLVIHHELLAGYIRPTVVRPIVVKLHGDSRLAPRNTKKETASLEATFETQVIHLLKDRGIIFLGYGGNDRSIRRMLNRLPESALPFGVFWVGKQEPFGEIRSWLNSRKAIWVQSQDFDELMLLLKDTFRLNHPDRQRFEDVFDQYLETYYILSNRIAAGVSTGLNRSVLRQAAKRTSLSQPLKRYRLFCRDGIRGFEGRWPLDFDTLWKLGCALGHLQAGETKSRTFILGGDSRTGNVAIGKGIAAGLQAAGARILYAGDIPTPGVALLVRDLGAAGGIVLTASHSTHPYCGLKLFSQGGGRLTHIDELQLERELDGYVAISRSSRYARPQPQQKLRRLYIEHLRGLLGSELSSKRFNVIVDCGNGAASGFVRDLFKNTRVQLRVINDAPTGRNVNVNCGSVCPEGLAQAVESERADLGVAFDGDADRAVFATSDGRIVDGDQVLFALAVHYNASKKGNSVVVGTSLTSLSVERALSASGITLKRAQVGDRCVLEEMVRSNADLGGEASGNLARQKKSWVQSGSGSLPRV